MFFDCKEITEQTYLLISLPVYVDVVTVIVLPLNTVGGDNMLLIEKLNVVPLTAVLFKEFLKLICWPVAVHAKGELRNMPVDRFVQVCSDVEITGVNEELAESVHLLGNSTEIEPFLGSSLPRDMVMYIWLVEWTMSGLKLTVQL